MKIGIIGLGTVGEGVLKILSNEKENLKLKGADVEVKYACDLNIDREFDFQFDKNILITDYNIILNDPEIDLVIELIGGDTIAKKILIESLEKSKNVVTANKALIAKHAKEIFALAKKNKVKLFYEAAVGGGIPIITPLQESLAGNNIISIKGILNGTANYILTEMKEKGLEFDVVLKDAMEKGYAEADPTYDIEGIDTAHKVAILAGLGFNKYVDIDKIAINGITKIAPIDFELATELNSSIKLIASAKEVGDKLEVVVAPTLVKNEELIGNVNGVFNAIEVVGDYVGKTLFYGRGAGMEATASAVVSDVVKTALKCTYKQRYYINTDVEANLVPASEIESKYYIRVNGDIVDGLKELSEEVFDKGSNKIVITKKVKFSVIDNLIDENASVIKID